MTESRDFSSFARPGADGSRTMELALEGVSCMGCIGRIESALKRIPDVTDARLNFTSRRLTIAWKNPAFEPVTAIDAVERLGYRAHPFRLADSEQDEIVQSRFLLRCLGVAGFAAMNIMLLSVSVWSGNVTDITPETRDLFHWLSALIALPAAAYSGQPFFRSAFRALRARQVNMDVPISLGITLALAMSLVETANHATHAYFDSAIMLIFFLLCGRCLDHLMRRRTRAVAGNLAALKAETGHRISGKGEVITVPATALRVGDRILVRPGERVPADSVVLTGQSEIDEGLVTGETSPRNVTAAASVYAGSINLNAALTLRVTAAGENTLLEEIDRLLQKAVTAKSRYVRLSDRAASYYAPVVHSTAALTLIGWLFAGASAHDAILIAISVLIITCPCALALAIPVVQVMAAGKMFRSGIFLNSGDAIERLAEADTVVFDKTGTLTLPDPRLVNSSNDDKDLLEYAARLALTTQHPLAAAIARHAATRRPFEGAVEEPGCGVRATIGGIEARLGSFDFCGIGDDIARTTANIPGTSILGFRYGERYTVFTIGQSLRPETAGVLRSLTALGLDIRILSGDRLTTVASLADSVGVHSWQAGLKPADKVAVLEALKAEGHRVLMVGDGINDAPSLACAYVSMSPISAADISQAQADAVFLGERLTPVVDAITTARRARTLMKQNLGLAVIYNAIAVPIAVAGLVTPLIAAVAMSLSSILVTLNALRLGTAARPDQKRKAPLTPPATVVEAT